MGILVLAGGSLIYFETRNTSILSPKSVPFEYEGNLVINNPGFKADTWYLVYEVSGKPALTQELVFTAESVCTKNEQPYICADAQWTSGDRVRVKGIENDTVVTVALLTYLNEELPENSMIRVRAPQENAQIVSPIRIEGEAKGTWYFEASFPIKILDANGKELGSTIAQAQGDWMTEAFVPFAATLVFSRPTTESGTLVLQRDNPSGLPQNNDELKIAIRFAQDLRDVQLYYYSPEKDTDRDGQGNLLCSREGLVAVDRTIPRTITPIQNTIDLLLEGILTEEEKARGVTTEYPLPGLELKGASLNHGELTLEFADPQNKTGGGSCRVGILWFQIEATAKQFPEVQSVRFIPEELFQP